VDYEHAPRRILPPLDACSGSVSVENFERQFGVPKIDNLAMYRHYELAGRTGSPVTWLTVLNGAAPERSASLKSVFLLAQRLVSPHGAAAESEKLELERGGEQRLV
jgi:hypothetical protein